MAARWKLYSLFAVLLSAGALAAEQPSRLGSACNMLRNRLNAETHRFGSDCDSKTYCSPNAEGSTEGVCKAKGCRHDEFPFGYKNATDMPPMCPSGQFCPDEEDQCLPVMPVQSTCQLNRDDQCQPPSNAPDLLGQLNNNGAMCFQFSCQYANLTLGEACEVENIVYIGYSAGGGQNVNIISRDRCAPKLWCNAQAGPPQCQTVAKLGEQCIAHKQCETYTCNSNNVCADPPGTPLKIQLWQYIVTGVGIIAVMIGTSIGLFTMHKRSRAKKLREIREYFREQTSYRNSIITMHSHARDRLSMYSVNSLGGHTRNSSLSQFGGLGRDSFDGIEEEDADRRGLLGRASGEGHPEHDHDSDDEGVGHTYAAGSGAGGAVPLGRPISRLREGWNPTEWGARR